MKALHFASKAAYQKWNAYRAVHHIKHPLNQKFPKVLIHGKVHKVLHTSK